MKIVVEIQNRTKTKVSARRFFISAAKRVLEIANSKKQIAKISGDVEISLVFVSSRHMQRLNKWFRGKDKPTDVLSFPNFPASLSVRVRSIHKSLHRIGKIIPAPDPDGVVRLGEIIIALSIAEREATLYGHTVRQHHAFLFTHGLLHLLGYDHETLRRDEVEMQKVQQHVILNSK